jgi:8-oxo-dGTP diphosphatase
MAHIHEKIDWAVVAFILHPTEEKLLMINHIKLGMWLPIGGHVELDEDPDQALAREIEEECGLEVEMLNEKNEDTADSKGLYRPHSLNVHAYNPTHQHICLSYAARALTTEPRLAPEEHTGIRWFTREEIEATDLVMPDNVRQTAIEVLELYA